MKSNQWFSFELNEKKKRRKIIILFARHYTLYTPMNSWPNTIPSIQEKYPIANFWRSEKKNSFTNFPKLFIDKQHVELSEE